MPGKLERRIPAALRAEAVAKAEGYGHDLSDFDYEVGWHAAVAECHRCLMIVAVDMSEEPYVFGQAIKNRCKRK